MCAQAILQDLSAAVREQEYSKSGVEQPPKKNARCGCCVHPPKSAWLPEQRHPVLVCVPGDWVQLVLFSWHGLVFVPDYVWAFLPGCAHTVLLAAARLQAEVFAVATS